MRFGAIAGAGRLRLQLFDRFLQAICSKPVSNRISSGSLESEKYTQSPMDGVNDPGSHARLAFLPLVLAFGACSSAKTLS